MACRPDEQNRFTVTADASTGIPARRLAMRATFMPCSASGIAQPRITSSTSEGSMPGARRSASAMATAPSSSGRVPRSVPPGALPAAVRAAATMTASTIPVLQEIVDCLGDFRGVSLEEMIRRVNDDELFRLFAARVKRADALQRTELVELAVNEKLRLRARLNRREIVAIDRQRDADERRHARIGGAGRERNPRSERHAAGPQGDTGIPGRHEIERGLEIVRFTGTVAECAGACARAAE